MLISAAWHTYIGTLDIFTLVEGRKTLIVDFKSGNTLSILNSFSLVTILYLLFLLLLESKTFDCKYLFPYSFHLFVNMYIAALFFPSLSLQGEYYRPFQFPAALCILRCLPCAARYMCTKLNVKSSYNHIKQWMKRWDERKQQLLQCRSIMRWDGVIKYVPLA